MKRHDDIFELKNYSSNINVEDALQEVASELSNIATQTDEHLESAMPHQFTSLKTGKKYRYGRQVSADGIPQIISEEVV